ncbi:MAG: tryptophan synthase subunit alpha [Nitrospinaceae bacterium]
MSRIQDCFKTLSTRNQKALVAFITAGDPDLESTRKIFEVIEKNGADIIELGVPFSDPLADGPVIQGSSQRALKSGTTLKKILGMVAEIRENSQIPIVLMTSFNPVFVYGQEKFIDDALRAGADGVIIPDLPPEEADEFSTLAEEKGLDMIFLLAPTSTGERVARVGNLSRGFIYYVSLTGTTGMRESLAKSLAEKVKAIKSAVRLPVLVGFGISGPDQAREAVQCADGVVVGSAIVRLIEQNGDPLQRDEKVGRFVAEVKKAISQLS